MTRSVRVATMRAAGLFVAISSVRALAPTAKRRDVGAFLGGAALTTLAPLPARADVKVDPNSVRTTKGGAKYVIVKEGSCPLIDPSGALGSCYPRPESYITIDYTGFLPNGQVFDSTEKKGGKPLSFRLGERQVVPGIVLCGNQNSTARSLNHRVVLHAITAAPARWRGNSGSSLLDRASAAASSPRNDLVKNYRVHPTHWLIST